jgi:hypothetical protein
LIFIKLRPVSSNNETNNMSNTMIFMSVDIAGSTDFKQIAPIDDARSAWLSSFETFFREFPLVLMGQIALTFIDLDSVPSVKIWKVIGDELVFRAPIHSADEALRITEAFYRAVVKYDALLFKRWPLRIRGGCWACDFTTRNIEIEIPEMESDQGLYTDYLGPEVDAGFRISQKSENGNVILSMELAELLASLAENRGIRFHYTGKEILKGVFGGQPYPLILISFEGVAPDLWSWELNESDQLRSLREDPPISPEALSELIAKVRVYLNRKCRLGLAPLKP